MAFEYTVVARDSHKKILGQKKVMLPSTIAEALASPLFGSKKAILKAAIRHKIVTLAADLRSEARGKNGNGKNGNLDAVRDE